MEAAAQLRYVANPNAARLASGATSTVGLLAPVLTSWYTGEVVAGVEEVCAEAGYDLLIGTADPLARERMLDGETRFRQRVDGVILVDVMCREAGAERLAHARRARGGARRGAACRRLGRRSTTSPARRWPPSTSCDLGHRRIGVVGGTSYASHDARRAQRPVRRLPRDARRRRCRAARPDYVVDGGFTIEGGRLATHALLDLAAPPTGVFAMSDEMAFGVLQALRERGLTPGRDLSRGRVRRPPGDARPSVSPPCVSRCAPSAAPAPRCCSSLLRRRTTVPSASSPMPVGTLVERASTGVATLDVVRLQLAKPAEHTAIVQWPLDQPLADWRSTGCTR